MSTSLSFTQMAKIHELLAGHEIDTERLQTELIESGLMADLCTAIAIGRKPNRREFRKVLGLEPIASNFEVWRILRLGYPIKDVETFIEEAERARFDMRYCDKGVLESAIQSARKSIADYDLVAVTLQDLGLWSATYSEVCKRGEEIGLHLCPPETALRLRLCYTNQRNEEILIVAMNPLPGGTLGKERRKDNRPHFFALVRDNSRHNNSIGRIEVSDGIHQSGQMAGKNRKFLFVLRHREVV